MKIRQGFVSNSSSSSFVAIQPNQEHIDNIQEYIENFMIGRYYSEDERNEGYFKYRYAEIYEKVKDLNNFKLISFTVDDSYDSDGIFSLLDELNIKYIALEN